MCFGIVTTQCMIWYCVTTMYIFWYCATTCYVFWYCYYPVYDLVLCNYHVYILVLCNYLVYVLHETGIQTNHVNQHAHLLHDIEWIVTLVTHTAVRTHCALVPTLTVPWPTATGTCTSMFAGGELLVITPGWWWEYNNCKIIIITPGIRWEHKNC